VRVNRKVVFSLLALLILGAAGRISAQGTAFFYQGRLNDGGSPATNVYDLRFALYDASTNGNLISTPQTNFAVAVNNGLFSTNVDFGPVFTGTNYWLSLGVRTNAGVMVNTNTFTLLWPRQALLPAPYAIFANTASNVIGTLSATQLTGTLPSAQVMGNYYGAVNFTNSSDTYLGTFSGNGLNLTNLSGSSIAVGTVPDARLSMNVPLLNTNQVFSGVNVFNNASNSFTGSFFGNGLVGFIPVPSNSIQAVRDTGYLLQSSNLTTVTLPASSSLLTGDIVRITGAGSGGWIIAPNTGQTIYGNFLNVSNNEWLQSEAGSAASESMASSVNGKILIAGGNFDGSGEITASTDSGNTWTSASGYGIGAPISLASSANGSLLYGVVNNGPLIMSTTYGSNWVQFTSTTYNWHGIACSSDGSKLVGVVNGGGIYTSTNGGSTLQENGKAPTSSSWYAVAASANCETIVAAINGGRIYSSTNFGVTWTSNSPSSTAWYGVASSSDGLRLAAIANGGGVYTSGNSGASWTLQPQSPIAAWQAISSSASGAELVAACNGGVFVSANGGVTWSAQPVGSQNWTAAVCSGDGSTMAAGYTTTGPAGQICYWQPTVQYTSTSSSTNASLTGPQGSTIELQYIGNNQFMPISGIGNFWAN